MKNKHLLLIWEEVSHEKEYLQKFAKIYEDFFCKFGINEFRLVYARRRHTDKYIP